MTKPLLARPRHAGLAAALALLLLAGHSRGGPLESAAAAFAREEFAEVLRQLPAAQREAEASLLRGRALLELGRHAEAEKSLSNLLPPLPQLRDLLQFLLGEALFGQKRFKEAAARFKAAGLAKNSRWIYLSWQRRAASLIAGRAYREAAEEYRHLLRIQAKHPRRPEWEVALALCQEKLGDRKKAAEALQEVWLGSPVSPAAASARKELDRLIAAGLKLKPPPLARRLARIRALRNEKSYAAALEELGALREREKSKEAAARLDLEIALTQLKADRPKEALAALRAIPASASDPPPWHLRKLIATCLARTGKIDEASALLLKHGLPAKGKLTPAQRAEVGRAAKLLAEYGRHAEALKLHERLLAGKKKLDAETRLELTWLAFRAGRHAEAIKGFEEHLKRGKASKDFTLYWLARAHAAAGQAPRAEELYRELIAKHPHTYYTILARSRLAELGKLKLPPGRCTAPKPPPSMAERSGEVLRRLAALIARYGDLYPSLQRAQTFWRLGMIADARRELRLIAIDAAFVAAKGRPKGWIQRPSVERLWRGGPLERRRFGKRERQIAKEGQVLRHALSGLLQAAGISYFAWQLGPADPSPERARNPRAYPELVNEMALRFKLDPNLVWAIMRTESSYRLDVISRVGATGLMQIMPHTGRRIAKAMGLKGYEHDSLFEPETNLLMATWYLKALSDKFHGQITLLAAGYNGGPHHVARWLDMRGKSCAADEFIEEIPFSESRRYAKKILRLVRLYERIYCGKDDRQASNKLDATFLPQPDF